MPRHLRLASALSFIASLVACAGTAGTTVGGSPGSSATPQSAIDQLFTADREFSAASMRTDLVTGISAMFAPDIATPVAGGRFSTSSTEAVEALRSVAGNTESHAEWTPVRGGISADGQQGFTLGYMTVHKPDNTIAPFKYLAYWVKRPEGWRIAAYRRRPRAAGDVSLTVKNAPLPPRMVSPALNDATAQTRFRLTLDASERAFSDEAQKVGLTLAFAHWGTLESYNMGAATNPAFVSGAENIGKVVGAGEPEGGSSVSWAPDRVIVSSSGDLGVTIGMINVNHPAADAQATRFPFFTVWHRANTTEPWRYIAE